MRGRLIWVMGEKRVSSSMADITRGQLGRSWRLGGLDIDPLPQTDSISWRRDDCMSGYAARYSVIHSSRVAVVSVPIVHRGRSRAKKLKATRSKATTATMTKTAGATLLMTSTVATIPVVNK